MVVTPVSEASMTVTNLGFGCDVLVEKLTAGFVVRCCGVNTLTAPDVITPNDDVVPTARWPTELRSCQACNARGIPAL